MARKITALPGLLAETTAAPSPAPSAPEGPARPAQRRRTAGAAATRPDPTPEPEQDQAEPTVRSTLDLPTSRHAMLLRAAVDTGVEVGWSVRPQHVLRAMFDQLIEDPEAMAQVRERIRRQGRPIRRRATS